MKRMIPIFIIQMFFSSCDQQEKQQQSSVSKTILVSDTDLVFQTKKQKIRFLINANGEIELLKIYGDTNPQVIHFHDNGHISQLTNKRGKAEENSFYFEPSGQIYKMKTFDLDTCGGDQYLWFANSNSKSILLDYHKCHVPYIKGLKDTFRINTTYTLTVVNLDQSEIYKTMDEFMFLEYDKNAISVTQNNVRRNELTVFSNKKGTFRITSKFSATDLPKKESGRLNKIDFNLTFD